jgi:hypothetical protein
MISTLLGFAEFGGPIELARLLFRILLDLVFTIIVVRFVYSRLYRRRDLAFTHYLLNIVTFTLCFLLSNVRLELGLGFGIFAVFQMFRYRTTPVEIRDLTYLFVVMGLGLLNSMATERISLVDLLIMNSLIVGAVIVTETRKREESRRVLYDRLDLLGPGTEADVLADLRARTRLPITRYDLVSLDLMRDTAEITIHYPPAKRRTTLNPADAP